MDIRIELLKGDITKMEVDVIVNAANKTLMGGGGVDGQIHRLGGKTILDECIEIRNRQGGCKTGEAVLTGAGNLPAKYVVHTVGPICHEGKVSEKEERLLYNAYYNSLKLAAENGAKTIAFPNISTGVYRFPKETASTVALRAVQDFLNQSEQIEKVIFVCFDDENYNIYHQLFDSTGE